MSLLFLDRPIKSNQAYIKNAQVADSRYAEFQQRGPLGAILHSIGTPQPSASVIAEYFDSPDVEASVHMVLQADGLCYVLAPRNYRMWHVGGSANQTHMGIEMTEPREISYDPTRGYRVSILDREKALSHVRQTYERAVELFALLCLEEGWEPMEDGVILSHREAYERGLGSNHGDPEHLWQALETGYTMDGFRRDVKKVLLQLQSPEKEEEEMRYETLGALKADPNATYYLPTVEKLLEKGFLRGKGGEGDELILDLGEDAVRILVTLDRSGVYDR